MDIIEFKNVVDDLKKAFGLTDYVNDLVKGAPNKMPDLPMTNYGRDSFFENIMSNGPMLFAFIAVAILLILVFMISSKYKSGRLIILLFGIVSFLMTAGVSVGTAKVATGVFSKIESVDRLITQNMR